MRTYQKDGELVSIYPIAGMAKPRMTKRDKWKGRPIVLRYHAYKDELRLHRVALDLQRFYHVIFVLPMPRSWSNKRKNGMAYTPHMQTPDTDNLEKGLLDALFGDDRSAWDGRCTKVWGYEPLILVSARTLDVRPHAIARMIAESCE